MAAQTPSCCTNQGQIFLTPGSTAALASLPNPLALDLFQVFGEGGNCLVKVNSTGTVTANPATFTSESLFERQYSRLASTATLAQIGADCFKNNSNNSDVLQVRSQGQAGVWHLDYTLTSFNS